MTKEIAEKIARGITDKIECSTYIDDWAEFWGFTRKEYEEFLDMAVKLSEQETVSKESYDHEYFLRKELEMEVEKLKRQLLEQEPKIGHWILVEKTKTYTKYRCSKCGTLFRTSKTLGYKHCPNCGVKNMKIK